jgi:hypothetical protein
LRPAGLGTLGQDLRLGIPEEASVVIACATRLGL